MLSALTIRDIVLIDRLDLEFGDGLSVMTGETGAGRAIRLRMAGRRLPWRVLTRPQARGYGCGFAAFSFALRSVPFAPKRLAKPTTVPLPAILLRSAHSFLQTPSFPWTSE